MKSNHLMRIVFIVAALLLALCTPSLMKRAFPQSQTPAAAPPPKFALFEFFKLVEPGKAADHRKIERELWMPIHRERVKLGKIKSWSLWNVRFSRGANSEYDRVTITTFDKFSDVEGSYPPEVFTKIHPNLTYAEILARTLATRKQARVELVPLLDSAGLNPQPLPPFAEINFNKVEPGKGAEYRELLGKYVKPLIEENLKRGALKGWQRFGVRYPNGTEQEYGQFTLSFFDKFEQLETQYPPDVLAKAVPGVSGAEMVRQLNATRKTVRTEVLTLLEQVQ